MSESRLETVLALVTKLAGMVDDKPALAEDLAKLVERYECMFCGELARDTISLCAGCEDRPKCEHCGDPCEGERFADGVPHLCDSCSDEDFQERKAGAPDDWWERRQAKKVELEARQRESDIRFAESAVAP
jgi:hypothetical protein